ncbi:MAG: DUF892 family protein [Fimbriimonadaceae bacterium]|nr:DUF892 family protein [Fimbriimonadaceae bacterium]
METLKERTVRYMKDIHAAEKGLLDLLDNLARDADAPGELILICRDAVLDSEHRQAVLADRLKEMGSQPSGIKDFTNSAIGLVVDAMNAGHCREDKRTMDVIKAHAGCHLLHGTYSALEAYASWVNDDATATMAHLHRKETEDTASKLLPGIQACARWVSQDVPAMAP